MRNYRQVLGHDLHLTAQLGRKPALEQVDGITKSADALWLCRGDLVAELGLAGMAQAVHQLTVRIADVSVPIILAGQVLEHMVTQPVPTRAEICN